MVAGNVAVLLIGALLMIDNACAKAAEITAPPDLIAFVEDRTGIALPKDQKIEVIADDSLIFISDDAEHAGADAAEAFGVIYIPERIADKIEEPRVQALIVHELTHVAQELRGNVYACAGQREAEAYKNQSIYLLKVGQFPVMSPAELQALANCEGSY